jgi:xanthine/uracil permease
MGIFAKFAAALVAIPAAVLGGMTTFLFSAVTVSGIRIISTMPFTRRNRFYNAIELILETGFAVVAFVNLILNLILPEEIEDEETPELTANEVDEPADKEEWARIRAGQHTKGEDEEQASSEIARAKGTQ